MAGSWEILAQKQVLVGILHVETVSLAWAFGLRNLIIPGQIMPSAGAPFDMARNSICQAALQNGFEYVFMLDSDVIPPRDAILRLLAHKQPIISGVYCRRSVPHAIPVMQRQGRWLTQIPMNSIIEVDVVGAGCLLPETEVLTNYAPMKASDVSRERVLTGRGRYRRVVATKSKDYRGDVVGLSSYSYSPKVWVTKEHPVFIIPKEWSEWCKPDSPIAESLVEQFGKFVPAVQVRRGDCLATPIFRDVADVSCITLSDWIEGENLIEEGDEVFYKHGRHPVTGDIVKYRNRIEVSEDFMEFCGFYVAEGSAGNELSIHLGTHEKDLIERVKELAAKCFGVTVGLGKVVEGSTSLRIGGRVLGQFFRQNFGASSDTKKIPQWMMSLPWEKQRGMLRGLVLGDGCLVEANKNQGAWVNYATVSSVLARQVQQLFLRGGYIGLLRSSPPQTQGRNSRGIRCKGGTRYIEGRFPVYHVNLFSKNSWHFAKNVLGEDTKAHAGKWQKSFIVGGVLYSPAKQSTIKSYSGEVYDFQVADDETYVAGNFLVHNCLLMHRSVLEKLPPQDHRRGKHWYDWRVDMNHSLPRGEAMSEDFSMCLHARRHGYKILVDTSIQCKHVGLAQATLGNFMPCEANPIT